VIYRLNLQTGQYEYISPSVRAVLGFSPEELSTLSYEKALAMIHPEDRAGAQAAFAQLEKSGKEELEYRMRTKSGEYRIFSSHVSFIRDQEERPLYRDGSIRDITVRKQAEAALLRSQKEALQKEQLRALAARIQQAREKERTMVARDLHDQIGQILTAIKMDMTWMARKMPRAHEEIHERLARTIELTSDGMRSVRRICSGLRPGVLDDLGLAAAIEWQAKEFTSRTGIPCEVSIPSAELRLNSECSSAIFRIFQESLTNVARHAEAKSVRASLIEEDETVVLIVQDDGRGFKESEGAGSLGILGMKERAQGCGGELKITSSPGNGTTVTIRIPVHAPSLKVE